MPRAFLLSIVLLLCPGQVLPMGGSVPTGYPSNFMMGYVFEAHVDSAGRYVAAASEFNTVDHYMASIGSGWAASYKYLIGGPRAAGGANCWWNSYPGSGGMPTNIMNLINARGYQPIFIYENLQALSGNYAAGIYGAFQSTTFMGQYFSDWADLMTVVDTWLTAHPGKVVTIDVEPDSWGYMQQNYNSNPASIPAAVATATNPGGAYPWVSLAGFPNTVQGAARALLHIKTARVSAANRSRLKLAFHVSSWAVAPNPATQQGAVNIATHAASVAGFVNACKTTATAGVDWDLLFLDPADGDAGLYATNGLDPGGTTHWWDKTNVTEPTFNRYRDWVDALSNNTSLRCMLWQMPIGNQVYKTMNNTAGHYQDNRAEYFLNATNGTANICDWAGHGVIGILWGRGSIIPVGAGYTIGTGGPDYWYTSWATDYSGGTMDNITNPGAGTTSTVADDDGGYLRSRMPAYFAAPCILPGVGTPTNSPTPSPNWSPTPSPTFTLTPQCPGGMLADLTANSQTNNWGGWVGGNAGGGSATFSLASPGQSGGYRARLTGTNVAANPSSVSSSFNAGATAANISGFGGVRFWIKGNAGQYRMNIHTNNGSWDDWGYVINLASTDVWTYIQIPYGMLAQVGWGPAAWMPTAALSISFFPTIAGAYDFSVDDIEFYCPPPTPTSTLSPSFSATPTRTPSPSPSPTSTATPSRSATPSGTPSRTVTPSSSATPTVSPSPTQSSTRTAGPSSTSTDTATATRTVTPTGTATSSVTLTLSPTSTATRSSTPATTPTFTGTITVTVMGSSTDTSTRSPTATSSRTSTPAPTATSTVTLTASPTNTVLQSATQTRTVTSGPSPTSTSTETAGPSATSSSTLTATPIPTSTATQTPSATVVQSATQTQTVTNGPSPTSSDTVTAGPSPTSSATPTASSTAQPTSTASGTATPGPSNTSTHTPAATFTQTDVVVATATSTPSAPTGTPNNGEGPNEVIEAWPVPHPNPAYFSVHVAGSCDRVQISFYTRAMACVAKSEAPGRSGEGWVKVPVPVELYASANGTYHYAVQSYRGGQGSLKAKKGNLLLLK